MRKIEIVVEPDYHAFNRNQSADAAVDIALRVRVQGKTGFSTSPRMALCNFTSYKYILGGLFSVHGVSGLVTVEAQIGLVFDVKKNRIWSNRLSAMSTFDILPATLPSSHGTPLMTAPRNLLVPHRRIRIIHITQFSHSSDGQTDPQPSTCVCCWSCWAASALGGAGERQCPP